MSFESVLTELKEKQVAKTNSVPTLTHNKESPPSTNVDIPQSYFQYLLSFFKRG